VTVERERNCNLCSATKRSAKIDKERWIEEQCKNIQHYFGERKTREAYRLLKAVKAKQQPRISVIKDKEGHVINDKEQVSERWAQYCEELYSDNHSQDESVIHELANISPPIAINEPEILLSEVEWAIAKLRNNINVLELTAFLRS